MITLLPGFWIEGSLVGSLLGGVAPTWVGRPLLAVESAPRLAPPALMLVTALDSWEITCVALAELSTLSTDTPMSFSGALIDTDLPLSNAVTWIMLTGGLCPLSEGSF